jgi:hypothetical protein
MITFPESVSHRISRENERAGHPLSGRKVPEYVVRDIRELIEKPCRIIDRIKQDQIKQAREMPRALNLIFLNDSARRF